MLSPSWLLICLIEAPDGIYAIFCQVLSQVPQCGLVNNWKGKKTFHNWEGLHTLSKKEKKKPINMWAKENAKKLKCEQSLKLSFNVVTLKKASFILSQFQNNVLNATESRRFRYFRVAYGAIICLVSRSQRVYRQPSNGLTVHHHRQKCRLRLTVKNFQGVSNLTILLIFTEFQLLKNS